MHAGRWMVAASLAVGALVALVALGGCAQQSAFSQGAQAAESVPASGESDVRRRARIRLELAANYLQSGQTDVALEEVGQAVATDPTYGDAYHLRGVVFLNRGDLAQAEDNLRRAQSLKPNDPDILHNYGWLHCQKQQYAQANQYFERALAMPTYAARGRTLMSQGLCYQRAGRVAEAEQSFLRSYELDATNPVAGYHLAAIMFARGEAQRAQFYIRRVNNGEFSNAESLWLGIKVERAMREHVAMRQLGDQLRKRFPEAKETLAFERGAFNE